MELESLELRDRRYRAQKALNLLKGDDQADERAALEAEIARYQEICAHEHTEEEEGSWRCKDCDLQETTAMPEPEPEPAAEATTAPEAAPAASAPAAAETPVAQPAPAAEPTPPSEPGPAAETEPKPPMEGQG